MTETLWFLEFFWRRVCAKKTILLECSNVASLDLLCGYLVSKRSPDSSQSWSPAVRLHRSERILPVSPNCGEHAHRICAFFCCMTSACQLQHFYRFRRTFDQPLHSGRTVRAAQFEPHSPDSTVRLPATRRPRNQTNQTYYNSLIKCILFLLASNSSAENEVDLVFRIFFVFRNRVYASECCVPRASTWLVHFGCAPLRAVEEGAATCKRSLIFLSLYFQLKTKFFCTKRLP